MTGEITTKLAYDSLFYNMRDSKRNWWYEALLEWNIPLKIKLFCWLMLENKILTWDNLCEVELVLIFALCVTWMQNL